MAAASHATATVVVAEGRPLPRTFPAQAQPRVYLHRFMDGAHRELLRAPAVARFFDLWHPLNAYLAEFAFHRSLAAGLQP